MSQLLCNISNKLKILISRYLFKGLIMNLLICRLVIVGLPIMELRMVLQVDLNKQIINLLKAPLLRIITRIIKKLAIVIVAEMWAMMKDHRHLQIIQIQKFMKCQIHVSQNPIIMTNVWISKRNVQQHAPKNAKLSQ